MKILFNTLLFIVGVVITTGCNPKNKLLQTKRHIPENIRKAKYKEYIIQPQDRLKVVLYKDPDLLTPESSQRIGDVVDPEGILVDAKGYIRLPSLKRVKVAGLTEPQASAKIERLYSKKLTKPTVYVEAMNKRLTVLGEVNRQGVVKIDKEHMNLFEALGFSGGVTDFAKTDKIIIVSKKPNGNLQIRKVDLTNFDKLKAENIILNPGDIVYVEPNKWKTLKLATDNFTMPFEAAGKVITPFSSLKYLTK